MRSLVCVNTTYRPYEIKCIQIETTRTHGNIYIVSKKSHNGYGKKLNTYD